MSDERSIPKYDALLKLTPDRPWAAFAVYGLLLSSLFLGISLYLVAKARHVQELSERKSLQTQVIASEKARIDLEQRLREQDEATAALAIRVEQLEIVCKKHKWCKSGTGKRK